MPGRRLRGGLAAALSLIVLAGCGRDDADTGVGGERRPAAGGGGALRWAVPGVPPTIDPLAAAGEAALLASRQVHEPLVTRLRAPYGAPGRQPGLVLRARPTSDRTVWRLTLRPGVRFQDGTPFDAAAVLANWRRWRSVPPARSILFDVFAVDAPRPDEVRFLLRSPADDLLRRLGSSRLGVVSPQALQPRSGEGAELSRDTETGTGPFRITEVTDTELELTRFPGWWGGPLGLGPALDRVELLEAGSAAERLELLQSGAVEVALALGAPAATRLESDVLHATLETGVGTFLGFERSVRGLRPDPAAGSLSSVWLTLVGR